jgi:hypothetical protein
MVRAYQKFWKYLGKKFNLETFIETGTADGTTSDQVRDGFKDVYTIEFTSHWHENAMARFAGTNVHPIRGDSKTRLRELLLEIPNTRTLFFLDAHFHGPPQPDGKPGVLLNDPLPGEIPAIMELRPDSLIVIDDQIDDKLETVRSAGVDLTGWTTIFDDYRMVMMYKNGSGLYWPSEFNE